MMKFLADKFSSQTGIALVLEYQKFIMTTFTNDSTLQAQLDAHLEMRNICAANKFTMLDYQYAAQMLCALPSSYHTLFNTILAQKGVEELTPDNVHTKVLDQEAVTHNRIANANMMNRGNAQASPSHQKPKHGLCHYCGKEGHHQKVCRKKKANVKCNGQSQLSGAPPGPSSRGGLSSRTLNVIAMEGADVQTNDKLALLSGCY